MFVLGVFCVCFFVLPDFDAIARSETSELRKSVCFCWRREFIHFFVIWCFFLFLFFSKSSGEQEFSSSPLGEI